MRRLLILAALTLVAGAACTKSQTPAAPPPPPPNEATEWGYTGATGPAAWGSLSPAYAACGNGKAQSPIALEVTELAAPSASSAALTYPPITGTVLNTGHELEINAGPGASASIDGQQYQLIRYHFHTPSEHTVGGKQYPAEIHFVHTSATGQNSVVGVFVEEGAHNAAMDPILAVAPSSKGQAPLPIGPASPAVLVPPTSSAYRYPGSLTTPPCTEGIAWFVDSAPITMDHDQLAALEKIGHNNSRPTQPLNGRQVQSSTVTAAQ